MGPAPEGKESSCSTDGSKDVSGRKDREEEGLFTKAVAQIAKKAQRES